jgi:hypothetical protein
MTPARREEVRPVSSPEQKHVDALVQSQQPGPNANLQGWVLLADWELADGEKMVTVMGSPSAHIVHLKGVLHEGLYDIARGAYVVASGYIEDVRKQDGD